MVLLAYTLIAVIFLVFCAAAFFLYKAARKL